MFVTGTHQRSSRWALLFAVAALGLGGVLPRKAGAILAGGTALALVCFNGNWVNPFEALTILALMFTGTMLYRAERGDYPWRRAAPAAVAVFVLATMAGL